MRLVNNFNVRQLDEDCNWVELKGEYELYEKRSYNLRLLIHLNSETYEVYPIKGYEHNSVLEGRRFSNVGDNIIGFSREELIYNKNSILEYLNRFFPQYTSVDVYILTEDVCYRKSVYTSGTGSTNEFFRDNETHELKGFSWKYVKFEKPKESGYYTEDILYRKIVDYKKIDTIVRAEGEYTSIESYESFYVYEHYYYDEKLQKEVVFYVGKGTGEARGCGSRIYNSNRNKFWQEIVNSLDKRNIKWKYRVVKFFNSNADALNFELKLQEYYWEKGQCLGCADLRRRHKYNQTSC